MNTRSDICLCVQKAFAKKDTVKKNIGLEVVIPLKLKWSTNSPCKSNKQKVLSCLQSTEPAFAAQGSTY